MAINRNNYEAYLLDYHDGNLSEDELRSLMAFLKANPDLDASIDDYEEVKVGPENNISFPGKAELKKEETSPSIEENTLIAFLEGDLGPEEQQRVSRLLDKNAQLAWQFKMLENSISQPEMSVAYPGKEKLKRPVSVPLFRRVQFRYAAAAVIIMIIGVASLLILNNSSLPGRESQTYLSLTMIEADKLPQEPAMIQPAFRAVSEPAALDTEHETIAIATLNSRGASMIKDNYIYNNVNLAFFRPMVRPEYGFKYASADNMAQLDMEDKTLAGKILAGLFNKVSEPFQVDRDKENRRNGNFSIWDIADFGVKSVNVLGDHEYTLVRQYNEKGNVSGVMILEE